MGDPSESQPPQWSHSFKEISKQGERVLGTNPTNGNPSIDSRPVFGGQGPHSPHQSHAPHAPSYPSLHRGRGGTRGTASGGDKWRSDRGTGSVQTHQFDNWRDIGGGSNSVNSETINMGLAPRSMSDTRFGTRDHTGIGLRGGGSFGRGGERGGYGDRGERGGYGERGERGGYGDRGERGGQFRQTDGFNRRAMKENPWYHDLILCMPLNIPSGEICVTRDGGDNFYQFPDTQRNAQILFSYDKGEGMR
eukprot:GHVN01044440.1.p1 GENE.GHVN01044440.1~~GHVN01044440.1.p1  ORF type:complete len:249 (+),score=68.05 GHVN01044440.1:154-900(+)